MNVVEISLAATYGLRQNVLGWHDLVTETDLKPTATHFAAIEEGELVGIGSVALEDCSDFASLNSARFWGVAVSEQRRRAGVGKRIIEELTGYSRDLGANLLWANARQSAFGFYESLGFVISGIKSANKNSGLSNQVVYRRL